jgi:N-methylhydantoinase A/oxoprolinase/acetone carboxylase beta subunit
MRIGIDTGGTFTDLVFIGAGEGRVHKVPSTPGAPLKAILTGLSELRSEGLGGVEVVHGTTVGTNAFLERRGSRVALLTTQGFEDVLAIGRQTRRELFNLNVEKAPDLLPRERIVGVAERLGPDGGVLSDLTADEIARVRRQIQELAPEAVAVCLLHAYANPAHEERLAAALADLGVPVSLSSRVLPEFREYERTCATVLNAYLSPILGRYLGEWRRLLPQTPLFIQQSNGGFLPADKAASWGLHTILSGPAGGVSGALGVGREVGEDRLLTLDMGGTSTDVALLDGGIPFTKEYLLQDYPLGIPVMDIHTVGAGGGSIAYRDRGGALRVGPRSAGAEPGPACYGRGREVTVTDAQLFLGRLRPESFLGGRLPLAPDATREAMIRLAAEFGVAPAELALGIIRVANQHMAKALQAVSLERGLAPRDFTLCCFGGAAGLHVCELARELEVGRILLPAQAGVLSALGLALAGFRRDFARTLWLRGPWLTWERLQAAYQALCREALEELAADGLEVGALTLSGELELRYPGQSYTLSVPLAPQFREAFHQRHLGLYGHNFPERRPEVVVLRLHAMAPAPTGRVPPFRPAAPHPVDLPPEAEIRLPEGLIRAPLYRRPELAEGDFLPGPALVLEEFATLLVLPGFRAKVLAGGHLLLTGR